MSVCVCERERKRETERHRETESEREREREADLGGVPCSAKPDMKRPFDRCLLQNVVKSLMRGQQMRARI